MRPAAHSLSFASPKESKQRKGDPKSATPSRCYGANLRHGACGVRRRTHCALARSVQTTAASQSTKRVHPAVHAPPRKHRAAGAATGVLMRAIAALGPVREFGAKRSDGPCCRWVPSGRAEKRRAWGGRGQRSMPALRALTRCGCSSGVSAANKASSAAPPQDRASQVARSEAQGHGKWGRLFFAYFLLAKQKKVGRPPGRIPGRQRIQRRWPLTPAPVQAGGRLPVQAGGRLLSPEGRGSKTARRREPVSKRARYNAPSSRRRSSMDRTSAS